MFGLLGHDVVASFVCTGSVLGSALEVSSGSWGFWDFIVQRDMDLGLESS